MTDDASLTDFTDDSDRAGDATEPPTGSGDAASRVDGDAEPEASAAPEPAEGPDAASASASADATPATSTYGWSLEGHTCPECGQSGERRWRDGDRHVCPDCKEW